MSRSDLASFVTGLLLGLFAIALVLSGVLGATALTLILVILLVFFLIKYVPVKDGKISVWFVLGLVAGVLLVILLPALSVAGLSPVQLLIVVVLLALVR